MENNMNIDTIKKIKTLPPRCLHLSVKNLDKEELKKKRKESSQTASVESSSFENQNPQNAKTSSP